MRESLNRFCERHEDGLAAWCAGGLSLLAFGWQRIVENGHYREAVLAHGVPPIYAFWHGRLVCLAAFEPDREMAVLVSEHRHGLLAGAIAAHWGIKACYGSANRRFVCGFHDFNNSIREGRSALIAVDGSRGPRGLVKPGITLLSRRTASPIVPTGLAAWPSMVLRHAWDHQVVPLPGARVAAVYGKPIIVSGHGREPLERAQRELQEELGRLNARARDLVRGAAAS